jgi:hypothetical protein
VQYPVGVVPGDGADGVAKDRWLHQTEKHEHVLIPDLFSAERNHLIERRHRVAHASAARKRNLLQRRGADPNILVLGDFGQPLQNQRKRNQLEIVLLAARQDCSRNLVILRGRHDENHVGRRFFKSLQEGIECCGR